MGPKCKREATAGQEPTWLEGPRAQELSREGGTSGCSLSRHRFNVDCFVLRPIMVTVKP